MGLGFSCKSCGKQLSDDVMRGYKTKEERDNFDLCDRCVKILSFDKNLISSNE